MNILITTFWKICLLRLAPQELPHSNFLMIYTVFAYVLVSVVVALLSLEVTPAILSAFVDVGLVASTTRLILWARGVDVRFVQTLTALMATGAILGIIALPLLWWQVQLESMAVAMPGLLIITIWFWNLAIVGHILRHALSVHYSVGVMIALLYAYASFSIVKVFFMATN